MSLQTQAQAVDALAQLLFRRHALVLTGAGCSTESGIPDYRGPESIKKPRNPIQYRAFVTKPEARVRYWARSMLGWPRFRTFEPNAAHRALAALERNGTIRALLTQNVDRLHQKAGSRGVNELHGALQQTVCLDCGERGCRDGFQLRLRELNPGFERLSIELAPDGDADLGEETLANFRVPPCETCGGVVKPDVVFFGENVPRPRVDAAFEALDAADVLLVVGSSLTIFSGYRFILRAKERGLPIAVVNLGPTRGDAHAQLRIDAPAGVVLPKLAELLAADA